MLWMIPNSYAWSHNMSLKFSFIKILCEKILFANSIYLKSTNKPEEK